MRPPQDITAVDADNFWVLLPEVLEHIAAAEYIGLDLEMTGIRLKDGISGRQEKLNIDEYYAAGVEAATAFQILEVGITCLRYRPEDKSYHWKSYNFQLAPWYLGHEPSNVALAKVLDRRFSLSSNTVDFLRASRGDNLPDRVLKKGIAYLSRQETQDAYDNFIDPDARGTLAAINIDGESPAMRDFYASVRGQITSWLSELEWNSQAYINIENPQGDRLTTLQTRLIHQLLETEFAKQGLRGKLKSNSSFMQITVKGTDADLEETLYRRLCGRELAVRHQTGFRYVFEALVGGDFAEEIDVQLLLGPGTHSPGTIDAMERKLQSIEKRAKARARVTIVHNSLFDLCFLYRSFVGDLPQTLTQFKLDLQALFPRLVDTKYMATRGGRELDPGMSLDQLYSTVKRQRFPPIAPQVSPTKVCHYAGYDSWITAMAFLKLSWKFGQDRKLRKT
ncbi:hypothetical protein MAPG_02997 [Magnaporthiopsis poae ATCC 64411]|uniref:Uncharacterized protein n=1 Tax=Magnaporthiopsis poae (strain ATCC 64411 / 73-15) TaxID=644358 RepID=A0A0C4DSV4_MAGP6|nr:hypothetical protein MAPG_02997 [Magnaporthiopsis poae ATCC 64411]